MSQTLANAAEAPSEGTVGSMPHQSVLSWAVLGRRPRALFPRQGRQSREGKQPDGWVSGTSELVKWQAWLQW